MFKKVSTVADISTMSKKKAIVLALSTSILTAFVVKSIYDDKLRMERRANEILMAEGKDFCKDKKSKHSKNKKKNKKKKDKLKKSLENFKKYDI